MSYQVFARKYRPRTFKDVLGQDHVVRTLCNAIEQKRLAHAYLFVGPRGTGKTSTARIFAKALNCTGGPSVDFDPDEDVCREIAEGRSLDVLEIDGASNRGIDNIRDLRDNVQFAPTRGQYRIIYIDEVHMLTKESFNALLKTLEEPPAHVMFIFATTEPHKILPTILSRCQRFDLRPIPADIIARHLVNIAANEGVTLSEAAAFAIARVADGGMRDAQSMLDQLVSFCGNSITEQNVNDIFGVTSRDTVARALAYMLDRQLPSLLHLVHELAEAGRDMGQLLSELMGAVSELLVSKVAPDEATNSLPAEWRETLSTLLARTPTDKIIRLMEVLSTAEEHMRWSTNKRLHLEMGLIQAVHSLAEANVSDIIRALAGAPLPETPIATAPLPAVSMPGAPAAATTPVPTPAPMPVPAPAPEPEPQPDPEPIIAAEATTLEPIDDQPPLFGDMPAPDMPAEPTERNLTPEDWDSILESVRSKAPLKAAMIGNTLFVSDDDGMVIIAHHPEDINTRDALLSEAIMDLVREAAQALCARRINLRLVTDGSVPPPVVEEMPPPPPMPVPAPKPVKKAPAPAPAEEKPAAPASLRPTEEEFYNDPLIELALKEFHATLIKN
ncbi:MAG: DNA polymerase III subunit gamma/tau [Akkermansia sp.]|nr:DNA polymerase III subunit gamma/tau [Akkermansia sp.]